MSIQFKLNQICKEIDLMSEQGLEHTNVYKDLIKQRNELRLEYLKNIETIRNIITQSKSIRGVIDGIVYFSDDTEGVYKK